MKKILSVILIISMLAAFTAIPGSALNFYPESSHNYADNTFESWKYENPNPVKGMYVEFSKDCYVEPCTRYISLPDEMLTEEAMKSIAEEGCYVKGDSIVIYDGNGELYGVYTGDELAGETLYIPGTGFEITLESDSSVNGYGFKINSISDVLRDENNATVNYIIDDKTYTFVYNVGEIIPLNLNFCFYHTGNKAIVGWKTEDGRKMFYHNGVPSAQFSFPCTERTDESGNVYYEYGEGELADEISLPGITWRYYSSYYDAYELWFAGTEIIAENKVYNFYPIYCNLGLTSEEVFSFVNSSYVFNKDLNGYVYTRDVFAHQLIDWTATFGFTPFMPAAAIVNTFLMAYWPTSHFSGSCCGFPIAAMLQHYGKIDLLSEQGVESVSELEPTEEIQSVINFYNNSAVACHLINHQAFNPGTLEYSYQLKALYETLEKGIPVYFEFYPYSQAPINSIKDFLNPFSKNNDISLEAHGILLSGAYTDNDGNHVILAWDNNSSKYSNGYADTLVINKDFTSITFFGYGGRLNGFEWNESIDQFASFPTKGIPNPFAWHIAFFKHIFEIIKIAFASHF